MGQSHLHQLGIIFMAKSRRARQLEELLGVGSISPRRITMVLVLNHLHGLPESSQVLNALDALAPIPRLGILGLR
jgi:hypothetical protein